MGTPLEADAPLSPDHVNSRLFDSIDALTCALVPDEATDEPISARLQRFSDALGPLAEAANDAALPGLIDTSALLADRISAVGDDPAHQETVYVLLAQFPLVLMDYVLSPVDRTACDGILGFLQSDDWQIVMADEEVDLLRMLLLPPADMEGEIPLAASSIELDYAQMEPDLSAVTEDSGTTSPIGAASAESEEPGSTPATVELAFDPNHVQTVTSDMLALAAEAFEANYIGLHEAVALVADQDQDRRLQGWEQLRDELDRMAGGADAIGLGVLAQLLSGIQALLGARQPDADPTEASVLALLGALPECVRGYLSAPTDPSQAELLVGIIRELDVDGILVGDSADLAVALARVELAAPESVASRAPPGRGR